MAGEEQWHLSARLAICDVDMTLVRVILTRLAGFALFEYFSIDLVANL